MRRRHTGFVLAAAPLVLTGCASAYQTSPTAGLADAGRAAYPADTYGPSLVAGDALAFNIMLVRGYDTPTLEGPRPPFHYASANAD